MCFEYLDRVLRDVTRIDALFGGKVVILGGDFRQIPTVIPRGSRAQVCEASLKRAFFWPAMKKMELAINMRVQSLSGTVSCIVLPCHAGTECFDLFGSWSSLLSSSLQSLHLIPL